MVFIADTARIGAVIKPAWKVERKWVRQVFPKNCNNINGKLHFNNQTVKKEKKKRRLAFKHASEITIYIQIRTHNLRNVCKIYLYDEENTKTCQQNNIIPWKTHQGIYTISPYNDSKGSGYKNHKDRDDKQYKCLLYLTVFFVKIKSFWITPPCIQHNISQRLMGNGHTENSITHFLKLNEGRLRWKQLPKSEN